MVLGKKADKETVKILLQENKRLKVRNRRLAESLGELQRYKDEYRTLIEELNQIKDSYTRKMEEFEDVEKQYRAELDRVMKDREAIG